MTVHACAIRITKKNVWAIVSEGGTRFGLEQVEAWLEEVGEEGYFVRDEHSPLDCHAMMPEVFTEIYMFEFGDEDALFRPILKK